MKRLSLAAVFLILEAVVLVAMPPGVKAASASRCSPRVVFTDESWRLGNFTAPDGTSIADVTLVDVNGDGYPDLFVAEGTTEPTGRQNHLLMNDGHGNFVDETAQRLPLILRNSTKVSFGDIAGNGHMDAIVANAFGDSVGPGPHPPPTQTVQLLLNDGHGYFRDASDQLPKETTMVSSNVTLADLDGTGKLDAVVSNEFPFDNRPDKGAQSWIWMNDGHGHFTDETATRMPKHPDQTSAILPADLTRSGYPDLIVLNRGQTRIYVNDGTGHFTEETATRFPTVNDASRDGVLARFDHDGKRDLLVANSRHQPLTYYRNDGSGHFTAVPLNIPQNPNELDTSLAAFKLFGKTVVFVANAGEPTVPGHDFSGGQSRFLVDDGKGNFTDETATYFPNLPADPTLVATEGVLTGHNGHGNEGLPAIILGNATETKLTNYLRLYQAHRQDC